MFSQLQFRQINHSCLVEIQNGIFLDQGTGNIQMGFEQTGLLMPDIGSQQEKIGALFVKMGLQV